LPSKSGIGRFACLDPGYRCGLRLESIGRDRQNNGEACLAGRAVDDS